MPIYQVEIFGPRKLSIVRVAKKAKPASPKSPVASAESGLTTDGAAAAATSGVFIDLPSPSASGTIGAGITSSFAAAMPPNASLSMVSKDGSKPATTTPPCSPALLDSTGTLVKLPDDVMSAEEEENLPTVEDPNEERTEKHDEVRGETYEVVFRVEKIMRDDPKQEVTTPPSTPPPTPSPPTGVVPDMGGNTSQSSIPSRSASFSAVPPPAASAKRGNVAAAPSATSSGKAPSAAPSGKAPSGRGTTKSKKRDPEDVPPPAVAQTPPPGGAKNVQFLEFPSLAMPPSDNDDDDEDGNASSECDAASDTTTGKDETTTTLDLEEELRVLLLDCIPGVRTIWNRCNSLKNIGERADDNVQSFLQVTFYAKRRTAIHILNRVMNEIGIGKDYGHVAMTECSYFRPIIDNAKAAMDQELDVETVDHIQSQLEFDNTLNVIDSGATLTFDFVAFLIIASMIAGTGLGVNSTVTVVASMLVSPMMGPILATVMGTVLFVKHQPNVNSTVARDVHAVGRKLLIKGFVSEMFCLVVAVALGFLVGLAFWNNTETFDWGSEGTVEMRSRTSLPGLIVGMVIAMPSGAGVALSLLGSNGNSLVGVAISASLLPPAVNCGIYMAFAINMRDTELLRLGAYSLCLTLINVVSVFISALATFYLKRAAPLTDAMGRPLTSFFGISDFDAVTRPEVSEQVEKDLLNHGLTLRGVIAKLDSQQANNNEPINGANSPDGRPGAGDLDSSGRLRRARSQIGIDNEGGDGVDMHEQLSSTASGTSFVRNLAPKTPLGTRRTDGSPFGVLPHARTGVFGVGGLRGRGRSRGGAVSMRPIQGLPLVYLDDLTDEDEELLLRSVGSRPSERGGRGGGGASASGGVAPRFRRTLST